MQSDSCRSRKHFNNSNHSNNSNCNNSKLESSISESNTTCTAASTVHTALSFVMLNSVMAPSNFKWIMGHVHTLSLHTLNTLYSNLISDFRLHYYIKCPDLTQWGRTSKQIKTEVQLESSFLQALVTVISSGHVYKCCRLKSVWTHLSAV